MAYKMLVDLERCIGCWTCAMGCKVGNHLADDEYRVEVKTHGSGAGIDRPVTRTTLRALTARRWNGAWPRVARPSSCRPTAARSRAWCTRRSSNPPDARACGLGVGPRGAEGGAAG